jgi:hypothetical protein
MDRMERSQTLSGEENTGEQGRRERRAGDLHYYYIITLLHSHRLLEKG